MDNSSVPSERIPAIARLALSLPLNWRKEAWESVEHKLSLVELKRGEGAVLYDWQGLQVATYSASGAIDLIDITLFEMWPEKEWDGNTEPLDAEMRSHFERAVKELETVIGKPKFCGNRHMPGFPWYSYNIPQDYAAVWELPEAILVVQADSNGNDEAVPWLVSACIEPYDEQVSAKSLVLLPVSKSGSYGFTYEGDWRQRFQVRLEQSTRGLNFQRERVDGSS